MLPEVCKSIFRDIDKKYNPEIGKGGLYKQQSCQDQGNAVDVVSKISCIPRVNKVPEELWKSKVGKTGSEKKEKPYGLLPSVGFYILKEPKCFFQS